jgi:FkbM family methyltransferase
MKLINQKDYEIQMTPELEKHFGDPYNYTREIMQQFDADYYKDIIKPGDVLLDIGANVGLFSLHVHPYFKRIICVEPTPEHFQKLKQLAPFAEHEQAALAGHTGRTMFHWCGINTTMNSLQQRGDRSFEVAAITLEDLLDKYKLDKVDFCKIDIEGSEDVAIITETLRPVANRLHTVFIELHPPNSESQDKWQKIFEAVGYKVERKFHDSLLCKI